MKDWPSCSDYRVVLSRLRNVTRSKVIRRSSADRPAHCFAPMRLGTADRGAGYQMRRLKRLVGGWRPGPQKRMLKANSSRQ